MHRSAPARLVFLATVIALLASLVAAPVSAKPKAGKGQPSSTAVLFASDGIRQDLVAKYAAQGVMPTMGSFLKHGASASGNGLLTEAPPNTGAGWYSLATGAWPGVTGSTNNTFHINGTDFSRSTSAFAPGILKAETIAQSAERGGLKVAQVEWDGGANATIDGPTIDYRSFFSGRGVATNFTGNASDVLFDDPTFIASFGLQFDTPGGYAGQPAYAGADPVDATGWSNVPTSYSPAKEMHLRVLDFGTDKYGLDAYIFDSTDDSTVNYDEVLFSPSKDGSESVGTLAEGQWADVKVTIQGGSLAGKTAGMLVKVETLSPDLSRVRLFHTSVARANATWPSWGGETGFSGDFGEYVAQKFPTSTAADFAILEAGVTSEETYVEQGLYWSTGHGADPPVRHEHLPSGPAPGRRTRPPTSSATSSWVSSRRTLPNGAANPAYDDVNLDGVKDNRVAQREGFIRAAYMEADRMLTLSRNLAGGNPVTFVTSDHGFAPQFLAIDASLPLVQLGLLSKPQTSNCRTAAGETIGKAKACWAGGALQVYLNVAGRDPVGADFQQVPADEVDATVAADQGRLPRHHRPQRLDRMTASPRAGRSSTAHSPRRRRATSPTVPGSTADMAQPDPDRRPRRVLVPAVPVRRRDAGHADRTVRTSSASTATCPTSRTSRPTSTCGRPSSPAVPGIAKGTGHGSHDRPRAHDGVPARDPRAAAERRPRPDSRSSRAAPRSSRSRSSASPTSTASSTRARSRFDGINTSGRRRVIPRDDVRRGVRDPCRVPVCSSRPVTTWVPRPQTPASSRTRRRSTSRTRGAWTPRPTATTSSTTAWTAS